MKNKNNAKYIEIKNTKEFIDAIKNIRNILMWYIEDSEYDSELDYNIEKIEAIIFELVSKLSERIRNSEQEILLG